MLSIEKARQILGAECTLVDSDIQSLLIQLEGIANIALDAAVKAARPIETEGAAND